MDLNVNAFSVFDRQWALVTAGQEGDFNTMTISWGGLSAVLITHEHSDHISGLATLWGKPVATVYVKPVRYTHEFLDRYDKFTVSFCPGTYKKALALLGSRSGRDGDKVAAAGLTPAYLDGAVTFREAERTLVCRKIYRQDLDLAAVPAEEAAAYYAAEAPHTMYIGQVLEVLEK